MTMIFDGVDATLVKIEVAMLALKALQRTDTPQETFTLFALRLHGVLGGLEGMTEHLLDIGAGSTTCR